MSADERGDDLNVQGGAVVEILLVDSLERVFRASVKTVSEFDGGIGAGAEVKSSTLDL